MSRSLDPGPTRTETIARWVVNLGDRSGSRRVHRQTAGNQHSSVRERGDRRIPLGCIDETEFRAYADRVNSALEETVEVGLFEHVAETEFVVVHRFAHVRSLRTELRTWTGTTLPFALRWSLARAASAKTGSACRLGAMPTMSRERAEFRQAENARPAFSAYE